MEENEAGESELRILYRIRGNARRWLQEGNKQAQSILIAVEELIDERERAPPERPPASEVGCATHELAWRKRRGY
jgi:hypothetical protein